MRFVKGATALHRYHRNPAGFILSEESPERIEMCTLYERALPLALTMLDNGETHLNVAIIGRLASRSVVGALAQILIVLLKLTSSRPNLVRRRLIREVISNLAGKSKFILSQTCTR